MRGRARDVLPHEGDAVSPRSQVSKQARRASFDIEILYRCAPGVFVDIEARVRNCLEELGQMIEVDDGGDLGGVLVDSDLTRHVVFEDDGVQKDESP